jgi:protein TonB
MSGLEEILFENRNKSYGAYQLRKKANKYLVVGFLLSFFIIVLTVVTLFVILNSDLFFPQKYPETISIGAMQLADLQDFRFPEPPKAKKKAGTDLTKPIVVDSTAEQKRKPEPTKTAATSKDSINKKGVDSNIDGKGASLHGDSLFVRVDKMPVFNGGVTELVKFLRKNLAETSKKCKIRQRIIVQFTVSKAGDVREVLVISGINPEINKEVVKVIYMLPRWEPAMQSGHPVSFRFNLPINL